MAFHKFIKSILEGKPIPVFGDGTQKRDFTYIDDIVDANYAVIEKGKPGSVYNIGGGHVEILNHVLDLLSELTGMEVKKNYIEKQRGDVDRTAADISRARKDLGYAPRFDVRKGLTNEIEWIRSMLERKLI
jgi:UDP-glucose 4-epimerase